MDDRAFASATELAAEIRNRRIGCVELLDFFLARAGRHNPALNAVIVWLKSAGQSTSAGPRGPSA